MRSYMDAQHAIDPSFKTGDQWYEEQAYRASNQGLGRCIRHNRDYGSILLLDSRFQSPKNCSQLSRWFRDSVRVSMNDQQLLTDLASFFAECARVFSPRLSVKREYDATSQESIHTVSVPREASQEISLTQPSSVPLVNRAIFSFTSSQNLLERKPILITDEIELEPFSTLTCPFCKESFHTHWKSTYSTFSIVKCMMDYRDDLLSQNRLSPVYTSTEERVKVWYCLFDTVAPLMTHFCLDLSGNTVVATNGDTSNEVYNEVDKTLYI